MALTTDDIAAIKTALDIDGSIDRALIQKLEPITRILTGVQKRVEELGAELDRVDAEIHRFSSALDTLDTNVRTLGSDVRTIQRTVDAFQSQPMPYGRPKTYFSGTQYHSVTRPKNVRQSRQG